MSEPKEYFEKNYWLGDNELIILGQYNVRYNNYVVREKHEQYNIVFRGTYKDCIDYCEKAHLIYLNGLY